MIIHRLLAEPFCDIKYYEIDLNEKTAVLPARYAREFLKAVSLLLKINGSPYRNVKKRAPYTRVEADISVKNLSYYIKAEKIGRNIVYSYNTKSENTAEEKNFYYLTRRLPEEDRISFFCEANAGKYPLYFKNYLDAVKNYWMEDYAEATNGVSGTQFFRNCLMNYLEGYIPQPFYNGSLREIALSESGSFYIEERSVKGKIALPDESEMRYFNFLCFLNANEFWQGVEKTRDLNHVSLPLFITDLGDCAKSRIFPDRYAERAALLGRQALFFV